MATTLKAKRLEHFREGIFAELNEKKEQLLAEGKQVYNLSVGTPDFLPPAHVMEAVCKAAAIPENYKYSLRDLPELLEAVSFYYKKRFGVEIAPDCITGVHGTQEGMGHVGFFRWLCMKIAKLVHFKPIPIFITFMLIYVASVFLVSLEGQDLGTCFTAVLATLNNIGPGLNAVGPAANFGGLAVATYSPAMINNIGPGLGMVGPTGNFSQFSDFSKLVLTFDMLAGRLGLFLVVILFHPALWKDALASRRRK